MSNTEIAQYFALHQPKLRAYIRASVFNPSDVDDILQEVAMIAIEKSDRYDASRPVDGWVFGIARNRIFKYIEKQKRQKLCFSTETITAIGESAAEDPDSDYSLEALQCCLDKVEPDKRDLLVRRHQTGTTARQLANEIGYTDTRMSRLINSLYASLMRCVQEQLSGVS